MFGRDNERAYPAALFWLLKIFNLDWHCQGQKSRSFLDQALMQKRELFRFLVLLTIQLQLPVQVLLCNG
jgi:hypothetical protein